MEWIAAGGHHSLAKRFAFALGVAFAMAFVASAQPGAQPSEFQIVSGDGYEGAIVPASSGWHGLFVMVFALTRGPGTQVPPGLTPWTPEPADIAATERYFLDFVTRAAKEPSQVLATLPADDRAAIVAPGDLPRHGLAWLAANVGTLKRRYWGFASGNVRRIAVHGEPDEAAHRWRDGRVPMSGGGCGNFWLDFNLTEARVVRFTCGGDE